MFACRVNHLAHPSNASGPTEAFANFSAEIARTVGARESSPPPATLTR